MRLCLVTAGFPPADTEGIARQRSILAAELARLGHEVHVVTLGSTSETRREQGVWVHRVGLSGNRRFLIRYPGLDHTLTRSQALFEGLRASVDSDRYDIVDIPLWGAQGIVTQQYITVPTVIWLQTTTVQLLKLQGRGPSADEQARLALETLSLERASGILGDSHAIVEEVRRDYGVQPDALTGVAHLGLPALSAAPRAKARKSDVRALVVGRLEKRKGTDLLLRILPVLLRRFPQLDVHFVGRDNSASDGWQLEHGVSYPEYFQKNYPAYTERVHFEGYVSEARLQQHYRQADLLLTPSLYESFGLVYLEAMRARLPVITFAAGAAAEIFASGEADGATLVQPHDGPSFASAIGKLIDQPDLRVEIGENGLKRFQKAFTAGRMAEATLKFYEEVINHRPPPKRAARVYQVMEALDEADAVSSIAIRHAATLQRSGQPGAILTRYANERVRHLTAPRRAVLEDPLCNLIFHYWGYSHSTWMLSAARGRKALYYHNITPSRFFESGTMAHRLTSAGYRQLPEILDHFDLLIGDSRFNLTSLKPYLHRPTPALPIYPVVDPEIVRSRPFGEALLTHLRASRATNLVFVGRIARSKRQDRLLEVFDVYFREIDPHAHLWLVGNENSDPPYRAELELQRRSLPARDHIHFTGKVRDSDLYSYYRAAHIFLSASEHEGFGLPLAEAMAFDIPVLAYARTAVPETMGAAGILIQEWDVARVAGLVQEIVRNSALKERLIAGQRQNLERFTVEQAGARLQAAIEFLQGGEPGPLMEELRPKVQ